MADGDGQGCTASEGGRRDAVSAPVIDELLSCGVVLVRKVRCVLEQVCLRLQEHGGVESDFINDSYFLINTQPFISVGGGVYDTEWG